ncbi:MAG: nickel-responsive transcriptional regulator NikR [Candidatus Omnitrophica bacterium]|nr:nickel-responsive transcriptional regulator NikR [Candidatus Omnitrophota bacterium]
MSGLVRFGVSLEKELLEKLDNLRRAKGYPTRSEAIRALVRQEEVKRQWSGGDEVVGAVSLVYDHHRRELINKITSIQHDYGRYIIASQHVHIDHHNCLEIIAVKGKPEKVQELADRLKSVKGVKHGSLSMATTGKHLG